METDKNQRLKPKSKKKKPVGCLIFIILFIIILIYILVGGGLKNIFRLAYPIKYSGLVEKYSAEYGVDKYLVYAVIKSESGFDASAESSVGAKGLMQVMDETAEDCKKKLKLDYEIPKDLFEPECNIQIGTYYLSHLIELYGDVGLAITAYNAGSGNVRKWLKNTELSDGNGGLSKIPFGETKNYLKKVTRTYDIYKRLY